MATKRKRYIISVSDKMFNQIEDYKEANGFSTYSTAIQDLVRIGLESVERKKKTNGNYTEDVKELLMEIGLASLKEKHNGK